MPKVEAIVADDIPVGGLPDAKQAHGLRSVNRIHEVTERAKAGDVASRLFTDGMAAQMAGDMAGSFEKFAAAAHQGSVIALTWAAGVLQELGRRGEARSWYEAAANAGESDAMYNMGSYFVQDGDRRTAALWFQRAAEAGSADACAALVQLADEDGDKSAERHWALRGARAGQLFCIGRYGLLLAMDARNGNRSLLHAARAWLEVAAERGHTDSASLAVSVNHQLGEPARARRFVEMVVRSGDPAAIDRLRRHGLL